jgi:hypothetical protein
MSSKQRRCIRCGRYVSEYRSSNLYYECMAEFTNRLKIKRYELIVTTLSALLLGIVIQWLFG